MADLVSIEEAKRQIRWTDSELALKMDELQSIVDQATAIILAACNTTSYWREITPTWTDSTVPATVKTCILKQVAYLNQFRGDDPKGPLEDDGLAPGVRALLRFTSDPVVV